MNRVMISQILFLVLIVGSPQRLVLFELLLLGLSQLGVARHGVHWAALWTLRGFKFGSGRRTASLNPVGIRRVGTGAVPLGRLQVALRVVLHLVVVQVAGPSEGLTTDIALIWFLSCEIM